MNNSVNKTITINPQQEMYLQENPEINLSELTREALEDKMRGES